MGFQSQAGHVMFRTQAAKGAFLDPASGGIGMKIKSGALGGKRELMIPDPEIGGSRDIPDALLGPVAFAGEYDFYARMDSFATLLTAAAGSVSSSDSGAGDDLVGTHVVSPIDGANLPWLSIEEAIADGLDAFRYTDARVNTIHLEADAKGYLQGTVGIIALTQQAIGASFTADPNFDNSELIVGSNTTLSFDGVDMRVRNWKWDLNNNMEDDDFRCGSLFLGDAIAKRRESVFGAQIRPEDRAVWRQAVYGDPTAITPQGTVVKSDVTLTCESYLVIGGTASLYSVTIEVPVAAFKPFDLSPSGDDIVQYDVEIECLRPDLAEDLFTATVVNHLADVA